MNVAHVMTMRAVVERNETAGQSDGWNNPVLPSWAERADRIPCYAWETTKPGGRKVVDGVKIAALTAVMMMTGLNASIGDNDRIARIEDRRGATVFAGPLTIDGSKRLDTHREWELGDGRTE